MFAMNSFPDLALNPPLSWNISKSSVTMVFNAATSQRSKKAANSAASAAVISSVSCCVGAGPAFWAESGLASGSNRTRNVEKRFMETSGREPLLDDHCQRLDVVANQLALAVV